jgi:acid phosphatase type 7
MNTKLGGLILATVATATAIGTFGCDSNRSGNIRATVFGDLSHALGAHTRAFAEMRTACDASVPAGSVDGPLQRRPYLQQLTARSVRVVWTTDASISDASVTVTGTDGTLVAKEGADPDPSARPGKLAVQWSSAIFGLEPDTIYCYQVQAAGVPLRRGGFRTAPISGGARSIGFVAFGDSGSGSADQRAVASQLEMVPFDFMIHLGDIGYETGSRTDLEAYFFSVYADLLENFAVFPASGNHEYDTESAAPFREAFVLPENGGPEGLERWYSYDFGDVHFVVLDTERTGATQAAWLDVDLQANRLPWTIVYFHRPPFSSGEHGSDGSVQRYFVPLFVKYQVPLVLSGHDHDYERTKPLDGVTYVVSGGGGRGTRSVGRSSFTAFSLSVCNFVYVTVNGTELTLHAIDGVGQEFDSFAVTRPAK